MLRRLFIIVFVTLFVVGDIAPAAAQLFGRPQQQQSDGQQQPVKKRRTLMDMLFGNNDDQQDEAPPPPVVVTKPKKAALPTPPKPTIAKSATATRLAVFGDSMAVDVAAALNRFYADDPNIIVLNQGVGSSGFARPDYFDWDKTAVDQVGKNSFDMAVVIVGINDRQTIKQDGSSLKALTDDWDSVYKARVAQFVSTIHTANKPVIWVGLPPMSKPDFSTAMGQVSAIQRLAAFSGGAEFVDIYDRFVDEDGNYVANGPDLNGKQVQMRKSDGIHFTAAGADKLAFYLSQTIKLYYHGGGAVGIQIADTLAGTDAALMVRPPYQGLGQTRLLEVAGAVIPLSQTPKRATDLVTATAGPADDSGFDVSQMIDAPTGRADAFGVGKDPAQPDDDAAVTPSVPAVAPVTATATPVAAKTP
jgi:hypothetical protein